MIVSRNIVSYVILVLWWGTMTIAMGMERDYPQLQLQESLKPLEHKRAHLSLASPVFFSTDPNPFSYYSIHFKNKPHRYLNDPLVGVKLSFAKTSLSIAIPAKHLFNLNDGSELQFILESPRENKNPVLISAFCTKNLLPSACFKNQFERLMASFYQSPLCIANSLKKLISAEVIKKENISDAAPIEYDRKIESYGEGNFSIKRSGVGIKNCMHGPKGCPDEQTLINLIAKPKTKSYNNSFYQLHKNRQTGAKKIPRPASAINLDLILDNCLKEMEYGEIAAEKLLDDCFNELVVMVILTRLLIILPIIKECASNQLKK